VDLQYGRDIKSREWLRNARQPEEEGVKDFVAPEEKLYYLGYCAGLRALSSDLSLDARLVGAADNINLRVDRERRGMVRPLSAKPIEVSVQDLPLRSIVVARPIVILC
jgi:hypothetical protein